MIKKETNRGFGIYEFTDRYGNKCSLQKSSLATEQAIWFGVDDVNPQIMGSNGWEKFEIPKEVLLNKRMHLTQQQVKDLLPILTKFVEKGEI